MNDALWVVLAGMAVFLMLALATWARFRRRKGSLIYASSTRRRSRRSASGRKPPTLAEVGGLPPVRTDAPPSSRPDAGQ